jgi:transposase
VLTFPASVRIFICAEPVDLRRGFDRLAAAAREVVRQDPMSGHVFAFLNRRRNRVKLLLWDRSGYLLIYKRLERGSFQLPDIPAGANQVRVDASTLTSLLAGIDFTAARKRWYRRPPA